VTTTENYYEILNDKNVNAVCVVTPTKSHFNIAKDVLNANKHLFIEKPLTYRLEDAKELDKLAKNSNLKLMVGHLFLFNPAVNFIKASIESNELGDLRHLHFQRRNLGPIRKDVSVLWDLAPHDISMILYFITAKPISALATGQFFLQNGVHDVVSASIRFENGVIANIILSWIDPIKIRDITIVGTKKMLLFDDVKTENKITVFDKNADIIKNTTNVKFEEYQIAINAGESYSPHIESSEPLKTEIAHFLDCITENKKPLTDGANGIGVVKILESLQKSLDNNSQLVHL
jgi:predicted dehydrogenase